MVRPASIKKPSVQNIQQQGVKIWSFDLHDSNSLAAALTGVDILVSAIGPHDLLQQNKLLQAAKAAGVKRIVPCAFITVAPPHGAMLLRDEVRMPFSKEGIELTNITNRKKRSTMPSNHLAFPIPS